ncbi:hypothetical protein [uncultured Microbacterium sp.]|uniref:hypothetical protein n=1 Tax=uncultured Microbacterium sp. TaxID=191216 RepID=UPI0025F6D0D6|nr:hypothetical protein [uncultured Microbacterium sp.]
MVDDPLVMQMRPDGRRVGLVTIAADGSGDFTTFAAAIAHGQSLQAAALTAAGLGPLQMTPNFRCDYLVKPGAYTPAPGDWGGGIPPFSAFYAVDPTPGATTLRWGLEPSGGFWWEGIDIVNVDNNGAFDPKYAIHQHAGATSIITRCTLTNEAPAAGGYPTPIGMDGETGATHVMHDVEMSTGAYTNLHGLIGGTGPLAGMTIVYSQCRFPTGSLYFDTLNDADGTEMWVVGGSADTAGLKGDKSTLHLDPATVLARTTGSYAGHVKADGSPATGTTDGRTDWPVPTGGLSARDRAYYGM